MGMLGALLCGQRSLRLDAPADAPPEKIRLIPDQLRISNVGRLGNGRLFFVDAQVDPLGGNLTNDYACTFLFDTDGRLVEHWIEFVGERNAYPELNLVAAIDRHLAALNDPVITDIRVRPFRVESEGAVFGLIPRRTRDGDWRVEFMPGDTLSFYPPWDAGGYDT